MSIFSFIGHLFGDLFSATKRAWNHLPPAVQSGLLNGSGILNIMDQFIGQDPKLTIATIQANYPQTDLSLLYTGLSAVARSYNLTVPVTLEDLIVTIQGHLRDVEATVWPAVMQADAGILATILSGSGTPFEIISTLLQFVYTNFIKGKNIQLTNAVNTASAIANTIAPGSEAAKIAGAVAGS